MIRKSCLALLFVLVTAAFLPCSLHADTPTDLNNRAVESAKAGRFDEAVGLLREALREAPNDPLYRKNLAGMLTDWAGQLQGRGRFAEARGYLEEAVQLDATIWAAWAGLGELYYVSEKTLDRALGAWTQAYQLAPPDHRAGLATRISRAQRDAAIERSFKTHATEHFQIRYDGEQHAAHAEQVGVALEEARARLRELVGNAPARVTVILYAANDFQRVSGRRDWALGLYDGRMRLRIDEIQANDFAPFVVAHELGHAYLAETFGPGIPTWAHEGFAQYVEPEAPRSPGQRALLDALIARTAWVPLKWLDRRFTKPTHGDDIDRAYTQARYAVDQLIDRHGMPKWLAWLRAMSNGAGPEESFPKIYGKSWARVDQGAFD